MSREELLNQKKERDEALKQIADKLKAPPSSVRYDLIDDSGNKAGYMEYFLNTDSLVIKCHGLIDIKGNVLKSLRDNLTALLDE